jgi:hypothetical protein
MIFIFLYSLEAFSYLDLKETFIFLQLVFIYAQFDIQQVKNLLLDGIRVCSQKLLLFHDTCFGGAII